MKRGHTNTGTATTILTVLALAGAACGEGPADGLPIIPTPAGPTAGQPNLFAAPGGRVHMSWIEQVGEGVDAVRMATLYGDAWSESRTITTGNALFVNWADFPSVIELPDGTLAAHWLQRSGPDSYAYDVLIARSDDGTSWSDGVRPHRDGTETEHGFVSLFPWHDGSLAAVWLDGRKFATAEDDPDAAEMTLRFATLDGDRPTHEAELDGRTCDCCQTDVAWTEQGPVVVYRDRTVDEVRDIAVVRHVDGAWTEPATVHDDGWVMPACPVNGPAVDADGDRVVVAWFTAPGPAPGEGEPRVLVAFSRDGGASFGSPVRVDQGRAAGRVDVELLGEGAMVTWLEGGDDPAVLARVVAEGPVSEPLVVAPTSAERASGFPRMVQSGDRLVFAWTVPDSGIRAAVRRLDGPERGRP